MPLIRIEVEEIAPGRWTGHFEGGGTSARRRALTGTSFVDMIEQIEAVHAEMYPTAQPAAAPGPGDDPHVARYLHDNPLTASERAAAESEALGREVAELPERNALREQAASLGIDVDMRWHVGRLKAEIARAIARRSNDAA